MNTSTRYSVALLGFLSIPATLAGCGSDEEPVVHDPATAERVSVDRFSEAAGTLQVRTADNGLPGPNEPIDFDQEPFITRGLGPNGESIRYYNLDVQPTQPAPIFALFREGEDAPVPGQLNIVPVVPGDEGYNDFWQINKVTVPADYVANTVVSVAEIEAAGYPVEVTPNIVNCPIVPAGSTARLRGGNESPDLHQGWYDGKIVYYFTFEEAPLQVTGSSLPIAPIYVTFNKNPDAEDATSGPASGFVHEEGSDQTHNVVVALPGSPDYSPLWSVNVYDNQAFDLVSDLASVEDETTVSVLATAVASVNCPVVDIQE